MRGILLDTHVLVWLLTNRLDFADWAEELDRFALAGGQLYVSAWSIVEMVMAGERRTGQSNRIGHSFRQSIVWLTQMRLMDV